MKIIPLYTGRLYSQLENIGGCRGASELTGDAASGLTVYQLIGGNSTNWAELRE